MAEQTIQRRSLTARVVDQLREQIDNGDYAAGDKLPTEPVLIKQFGFSRTVIREAIAALRADGLVESRQGVGVFVLATRRREPILSVFAEATDKISDIIEEMELRLGIEVEAAGFAALRSSPAQEAEIEAEVDTFRQLIARGESTDQADFAFHMAIAQATNNRRFKAFLEQIGQRIIPRVKFRRALGGVDPLPSQDEQLLIEHAKVAEAIVARDPEGAREAMRNHLTGGIKRYRAVSLSHHPERKTD